MFHWFRRQRLGPILLGVDLAALDTLSVDIHAIMVGGFWHILTLGHLQLSFVAMTVTVTSWANSGNVGHERATKNDTDNRGSQDGPHRGIHVYVILPDHLWISVFRFLADCPYSYRTLSGCLHPCIWFGWGRWRQCRGWCVHFGEEWFASDSKLPLKSKANVFWLARLYLRFSWRGCAIHGCYSKCFHCASAHRVRFTSPMYLFRRRAQTRAITAAAKGSCGHVLRLVRAFQNRQKWERTLICWLCILLYNGTYCDILSPCVKVPPGFFFVPATQHFPSCSCFAWPVSYMRQVHSIPLKAVYIWMGRPYASWTTMQKATEAQLQFSDQPTYISQTLCSVSTPLNSAEGQYTWLPRMPAALWCTGVATFTATTLQTGGRYSWWLKGESS